MERIVRPIGIHLRLHQGLLDVIPAVEQLKIGVVQSFLLTESNSYASITPKIVREFVQAKKKHDFLYFVHAAYWSGLTDSTSRMFVSLQKEVEIAQKLQSDGIVIHCGAIKAGVTSKKDRLQYVVESINVLHYAYPHMTLLLENTPHAGRSYGGNLEDFALILEHVEKKDKVGFCIDTTHAFVYGYDLFHEKGRGEFLNLVHELLGSENVKLLHLNDSKDRCGSFIDKHEVPGDGMIGRKALTDIMNSQVFIDVPIVMELPGNCTKKEEEVIRLVTSWRA